MERQERSAFSRPDLVTPEMSDSTAETVAKLKCVSRDIETTVMRPMQYAAAPHNR